MLMLYWFSWFQKEGLLPYAKEGSKGYENHRYVSYTQSSLIIALERGLPETQDVPKRMCLFVPGSSVPSYVLNSLYCFLNHSV